MSTRVFPRAAGGLGTTRWVLGIVALACSATIAAGQPAEPESPNAQRRSSATLLNLSLSHRGLLHIDESFNLHEAELVLDHAARCPEIHEVQITLDFDPSETFLEPLRGDPRIRTVFVDVRTELLVADGEVRDNVFETVVYRRTLPVPIADVLSSLPNLDALWIRNVTISREFLEKLGACRGLTLLSLSNIQGPRAGDFQVLAALSNLEHFCVSEAAFAGQDLTSFAGHPNLEYLSVALTDVNDDSLAAVVTMPKLKTLSLGGTRTSQERIGRLATELPGLEIFD